MRTLTRIVCDFCNADTAEAWFFGCDAFRFRRPDNGQLTLAEAGEVAACPDCRPFVAAKDGQQIFARFLANTGPAGADLVLLFQKLTLEHLNGKVRYVKLGDEVPSHDRFFERACPRCGTAVPFDRAQVKQQKLVRHCPNCPTELTIAPIGFWIEGK